ncbi:MAG: 1-acyl-sn-glycerol-3-phosphate acyltransferase [Acidobacteria bacterium]|nr:1-acyl-sn-glycerol-3-phosphate acyltransferase [Acidobacteriota bacterium]MCB9396554.1 1-acyl-sn-glycerol-3-phosphate acyltransferase [Acidobacteriota bacterium]
MRRWFGAVAFAALILICAVLCMISLFFNRKRLPTWVMRIWAGGFLKAAGVRLKVHGLENLERGPSLYMSNHASVLDIPALVMALPVDLRFIYKKSLGYVPFVGWAMFLMGMVPIDRANRKNAIKSLDKAGNRIKRGFQVLIFPEGTRTRDGQLLPFKKGGFLLAKQAKLPIVPVTILNSQKLCGRNSLLCRSGELEIVVHPPIDSQTVGSGKINDLLAQVTQTVAGPIQAKNSPLGDQRVISA